MKSAIILGIAVAAIAISVVSITMPLAETSQAPSPHYSGKTREFWLFNSNIPDFNETAMGMPHDVYSMPDMTVFKGDTVLIHFFNTEEPGGDSHSFTIRDAPYAINVDLNPGENRTISFSAGTAGIFSYFCTFHQPTMRGQLVVKPPPY